jgi:hypothetical protein
MASRAGARQVVDEALERARTLGSTAEFERVRREVRLALGDKQQLSGRELASIVLNRPVTEPARIDGSLARSAGEVKASSPARSANGCRGCGYMYAPRDESGYCRGCRPASLAARFAHRATPMQVTFPALPDTGR